MVFSQDNRLISLETPLGKDKLLLTRFDGTESISKPFCFNLEMYSEQNSIPFRSLVGENVTVTIGLKNGGKRYFNGIVKHFKQERYGTEEERHLNLARYSASIVPWFWLLGKTFDSRIFQHLSVPDIISKIFNEKGLLDYRMAISASHQPREYCLQYRETDLGFITRLMEEEGLFYFFEHSNGKHTMVIGDSPAAHKPCPQQEKASFQIKDVPDDEEDLISTVEKQQEIGIGKYTVKDYNFTVPATDLMVEVGSQNNLGPGEREIYDYPGEYESIGLGDQIANLRMQADEASSVAVNGSSNCRAFTTGYKFTLTDYFREDLNDKEYLLCRISHSVQESIAGAGGAEGFSYSNRFVCLPYDITFRPKIETPKPYIVGIQTAIVVGPPGEEIYTDEYGRIKVQFHWDREGQMNEKSSCWIRVGQLWSGPNWGGLFLPRIGQEVIVHFLEGDPDRPLVMGTVYHGNNMPPYVLPQDKTISTIKSNTTIGGGGYNEFRFQDKKDDEEIYIHGQKNWKIKIENDKDQWIGHNEIMKVEKNRTKQVCENQQETIDKNKTIQVGSNHVESIGANMSIAVGASKSETVAVASTEQVGGIKNVTVGGLYNLSAGGGSNSMINGDCIARMTGKNEVTADKQIKTKTKDKVIVESQDQMLIKSGKMYKIEGKTHYVVNAVDEIVLKLHKSGEEPYDPTSKNPAQRKLKAPYIKIDNEGNIEIVALKHLTFKSEKGNMKTEMPRGEFKIKSKKATTN